MNNTSPLRYPSSYPVAVSVEELDLNHRRKGLSSHCVLFQTPAHYSASSPRTWYPPPMVRKPSKRFAMRMGFLVDKLLVMVARGCRMSCYVTEVEGYVTLALVPMERHIVGR